VGEGLFEWGVGCGGRFEGVPVVEDFLGGEGIGVDEADGEGSFLVAVGDVDAAEGEVFDERPHGFVGNDGAGEIAFGGDLDFESWCHGPPHGLRGKKINARVARWGKSRQPAYFRE